MRKEKEFTFILCNGHYTSYPNVESYGFGACQQFFRETSEEHEGTSDQICNEANVAARLMLQKTSLRPFPRGHRILRALQFPRNFLTSVSFCT